jgi:hypothetical protein
MLRRNAQHRDLGRDYFDQVNRERLRRHHLRRLTQLGLTITVHDAA